MLTTKTLSNVCFDHSVKGIFCAVKIADKVMKAHCLPLEWTLKRSSPWCIFEERNKAILTSLFSEKFLSLAFGSRKSWESTWKCVRIYQILFFDDPPHFTNALEALIMPPEKMDRQTQVEISTIHRSRERLARNARTSRIVWCLAGARQQLGYD